MAKKPIRRFLSKRSRSQRSAPPPRVVVKFRDHMDLPYQDGVEKLFARFQIGPWDEFRRKYPGVHFVRLFQSIPEKSIREMAARASESDPEYRPPNLLTYFAV